MNNVFSMAEQNVIGWVLINPVPVLTIVRPIVTPGDFIQDNARALFTAACELQDFGKPLDVVTITARAAENGAEVDQTWITSVMENVPQSSDVAESARIIHDEAINRAAAEIGSDLAYRRITAENAVDQLTHAIKGRISQLDPPVKMLSSYYERLFESSAPQRQPTGFRALDSILGGGLSHKGMTTLAARTAVGKTAVALAIASNVARAGGRVLYISLEMDADEINTRRLAAVTGYSTEYITNRRFLSDEEARRTIVRGISKLSEEQFLVSDSNCKLSDIEKRARAEMPLDLLVVDHMGIIVSEGKTDNAYAVATERSHRLRQLANAVEVPVLVLCQINRQTEQRDNKRPKLFDLRDTGAIEEDSHAVILLYRDGYYQQPPPGPWDVQPMELNVAKNRNGQTGTAQLDFVGASCSITDPMNAMQEITEPTPFDERSTV